MTRKVLIALLALSGACTFGARRGGNEELTSEVRQILVEETNPWRNEWLHNNCEVKDVQTNFTANRSRIQASRVGANYVEVIYSASPLNLNVVMFYCDQIPPF